MANMTRAASVLAVSSSFDMIRSRGGVIAEQGDHETLLAKNGVYRELYETQFRTILELEENKAAGKSH